MTPEFARRHAIVKFRHFLPFIIFGLPVASSFITP